MRAEEIYILFFDWFDKYYIQGLEEASSEIQETVIKKMMVESLKNCRSSKAESSQVQKKKNRGQLEVSIINNPDQISQVETDRKSTRLNSSHSGESRMPSSA